MSFLGEKTNTVSFSSSFLPSIGVGEGVGAGEGDSVS